MSRLDIAESATLCLGVAENDLEVADVSDSEETEHAPLLGTLNGTKMCDET